MAMERDKALAVARQFVLEMYPPPTDSGHPRTTTEMREMLSQILTIAEFLSGDTTALGESVLSELLTVAKDIRGNMP